MTSVTELQHRIQRTRQYLRRLETELHRVEYSSLTRRASEEQRIRRLENEFSREYPNVIIDRSVLKLVGSLPSRGSDSKLIAQAIVEKYAK
jgi:hypothetical protein